MTRLKVFVAGQRSFGAAVAMMVDRETEHDLVGVCSPPARPCGTRPDPLRAAAGRLRVPWMPSGLLRAGAVPPGTDLIVSAHSHAFIGRRTLAACRLGGVGYHPSLLPRHRGRDAVEWTIRMRDAVAGGSVYWLSGSVDCGPIASQRHCMVRPSDSASSLWSRELFPLGLWLIAGVLADLAGGRATRIPQDPLAATWEPSIESEPLFRPELPLLGDLQGVETTGGDAGVEEARDWAAAYGV